MKPHGPIPPAYSSDSEGMLLVGGQRVDALVEQAGDTPLFLYNAAMLGARVAEWRVAMPDMVQLHYAMKANPFGPLLAHMAGLVDGLDVASGGELEMALASGMDAAHISFAGPGKRDRELEAAIAAGVTLNLESTGEAERALAIADRLGVRPRLAVRVNPDFDLKGSGMKMGGGAKPFGVDARAVPALVRRLIDAGADWQGFHIFAGSQALSADAIAETQAQTVALAGELAEEAGATPPLVNLGGGMGVPYFPGDQAVDAPAVGQALGATLEARAPVLKNSHFAMELGRWLVAEAGVYLTRIVDRKVSHGETFLVTDGGLHHQLAASGNFGTVIRRNYPIAVAHAFGREPAESVSVVGCLCTPLDRLGDQVALPRADVGDLVAIFQAGAYGASASPATFLGQGPAKEMLV
ncbi:pyridoxal-dependent decarboxylase, exosortase A system-associated [Sphingopyxis sp. MWB1]|uniref:pyridoxal-dependent decarboxylase, exosortase A system-associated n=1 Tax=Sphingopyxis sp. MWB1 TaxID=1537715 RepID=UPI00051A4A40|nr:pyridoxal-dependent decarboxylase, exosortase A system-associated [Sphingopyxis sp. MWB1]